MRTLIVLAFLALAAPAFADPAGDRILGEWRGQSLCTDRALAPNCHDEITRYVFTSAGATYHVVADKMQGGAFVTMGEMDFVYAPADARWSYRFDSAACPQCTWWFRLQDGALVGGLTSQAGRELRRVSATRP